MPKIAIDKEEDRTKYALSHIKVHEFLFEVVFGDEKCFCFNYAGKNAHQ